MLFKDIPGLDDLKKTLVSSFQANHVAHAQLFHSIEGGAALPMTLAFVSYILCENKQENDACGECPSCHKMKKLIHPDVHFFYPKSGGADPKDAAKFTTQWRDYLPQHPYGNLEQWVHYTENENKNFQISKEEARNIVKTVGMKSFEGNHKVLIVWYPELMHPSAANAILKVLEEPPAQTLYFLVSYNLENIITTITSRTQLVAVPPFTSNEISDYLVSRGEEENSAHKIGGLAEGSMLKAINLKEHTEEMEYQDFQLWMRDCLKHDFSSLVKKSEEFSQIGKNNQQHRLRYALELVRSSLLETQEESLVKRNGTEKEFISKFSKAVSFDALSRIYELINDAIYHLERNANPRISFLSLSISISQTIKK